MTVLLEGELDKLLRVPTTVEQAEQIKQRNELLLEIVETFPDKDDEPKTWPYVCDDAIVHIVDVGCPHCSEAPEDLGFSFRCRECAWQLISEDPKISMDVRCVFIPFGGVTYREVSVLRPQVTFFSEKAECAMARTIQGCQWTEYCKRIKKIKTFLLGHIEWAVAVIEAGGVPWSEKEDE